MVLNRYLAGLLSLIVTLLTAFVAIPESQWADPVTVVQFVALAVSTITAVFLPLLTGPWAGALKTGSAVILAVIGALVPLIAQGGHLNVTQIALLVLAGLNALAIQLGVSIRIDDVRQQAITSGRVTPHLELVDAKAASVVETRLLKD